MIKIKPITKLRLTMYGDILNKWLPIILIGLTLALVVLGMRLNSLTSTLTRESTSTAALIFVGGNINYFLTPTNNTFSTISEGSSYGGAAYFYLPTNCTYMENLNISIPFRFTGNSQTGINVSILPTHNATISISGNGLNITGDLGPKKLPVNISVIGVSIANYDNISNFFRLEKINNRTFSGRYALSPNHIYLLSIRVSLNNYLNFSTNLYKNNPYLALSIFATIFPSAMSINDYSVYENIGKPTNSSVPIRLINGSTIHTCFTFGANYN